MKLNDYQTAALKTASNYPSAANWALGLAGEAGEVADEIKKILYHGKPRDINVLKKEIGDVLWYVAVLADYCGVTLQEIAETNLAKLKARHGDSFKKHEEQNR